MVISVDRNEVHYSCDVGDKTPGDTITKGCLFGVKHLEPTHRFCLPEARAYGANTKQPKADCATTGSGPKKIDVISTPFIKPAVLDILLSLKQQTQELRRSRWKPKNAAPQQANWCLWVLPPRPSTTTHHKLSLTGTQPLVGRTPVHEEIGAVISVSEAAGIYPVRQL